MGWVLPPWGLGRASGTANRHLSARPHTLRGSLQLLSLCTVVSGICGPRREAGLTVTGVLSKAAEHRQEVAQGGVLRRASLPCMAPACRIGHPASGGEGRGETRRLQDTCRVTSWSSPSAQPPPGGYGNHTSQNRDRGPGERHVPGHPISPSGSPLSHHTTHMNPKRVHEHRGP